MRIKQLEIHGFKSFGDRVKLHFGKGITGVVGELPIPEGESGRTMVDLGASGGVTLLLAFICFTRQRVRRKHGWILLGTYGTVIAVRTLFLR